MRNNKKINQNEINYILTNYPKMSIYALSRKLKRSSFTIKKILLKNNIAVVGKIKNWKNLTEQELVILRLMAKGHSSKLIKQTLAIENPTFRTHKHNIYEKLQISFIQERGESCLAIRAVLKYLTHLGKLKDWEFKGVNNDFIFSNNYDY